MEESTRDADTAPGSEGEAGTIGFPTKRGASNPRVHDIYIYVYIEMYSDIYIYK